MYMTAKSDKFKKGWATLNVQIIGNTKYGTEYKHYFIKNLERKLKSDFKSLCGIYAQATELNPAYRLPTRKCPKCGVDVYTCPDCLAKSKSLEVKTS